MVKNCMLRSEAQPSCGMLSFFQTSRAATLKNSWHGQFEANDFENERRDSSGPPAGTMRALDQAGGLKGRGKPFRAAQIERRTSPAMMLAATLERPSMIPG